MPNEETPELINGFCQRCQGWTEHYSDRSSWHGIVFANLSQKHSELVVELDQNIRGLCRPCVERKEAQPAIQDLQTKLTEQITANQQKEQTIQQLQANLTNSEQVLTETREQLNQSQTNLTQKTNELAQTQELNQKLQEKWDEHLDQEKSFLHQEIQLIKEVLND